MESSESALNMLRSLNLSLILSFFFNLVSHVMIAVGFVGLLRQAWKMILDTGSKNEIFVRRAAFFCGFLIYIIAREFGVSIPNILADSLFIVQPLSFWMVFTAIFSGFVGIGVAWVTIKVMERNDNVAIRVAILLTTLVSCLFVDLYASAFHAPPRYGLLNIALLPNLTFVLGLLLYMILFWQPKEALSPKIANTEH